MGFSLGHRISEELLEGVRGGVVDAQREDGGCRVWGAGEKGGGAGGRCGSLRGFKGW